MSKKESSVGSHQCPHCGKIITIIRTVTKEPMTEENKKLFPRSKSETVTIIRFKLRKKEE